MFVMLISCDVGNLILKRQQIKRPLIPLSILWLFKKPRFFRKTLLFRLISIVSNFEMGWVRKTKKSPTLKKVSPGHVYYWLKIIAAE